MEQRVASGGGLDGRFQVGDIYLAMCGVRSMGGNRVEDEHVVPGGDEPIDHVTSDEPGATGDPDSHQLAIPVTRGTVRSTCARLSST
jgi:hypothetical protein